MSKVFIFVSITVCLFKYGQALPPVRNEIGNLTQEFVQKFVDQHEKVLNVLDAVNELSISEHPSFGSNVNQYRWKLQKQNATEMSGLQASNDVLIDCPEHTPDFPGIIMLFACKVRKSKELSNSKYIMSLAPLKDTIKKVSEDFKKVRDEITKSDVSTQLKQKMEEGAIEFQVLSQMSDILFGRNQLQDSRINNDILSKIKKDHKRAAHSCTLKNKATNEYLIVGDTMYNSQRRFVFSSSYVPNESQKMWEIIPYPVGYTMMYILKSKYSQEYLYAFDSDANSGHDYYRRNAFTYVGGSWDRQSMWTIENAGDNYLKFYNTRFGEYLYNDYEMRDNSQRYVFTRRNNLEYVSNDQLLWQLSC